MTSYLKKEIRDGRFCESAFTVAIHQCKGCVDKSGNCPAGGVALGEVRGAKKVCRVGASPFDEKSCTDLGDLSATGRWRKTLCTTGTSPFDQSCVDIGETAGFNVGGTAGSVRVASSHRLLTDEPWCRPWFSIVDTSVRALVGRVRKLAMADALAKQSKCGGAGGAGGR